MTDPKPLRDRRGQFDYAVIASEHGANVKLLKLAADRGCRQANVGEIGLDAENTAFRQVELAVADENERDVLPLGRRDVNRQPITVRSRDQYD